MTVRGVSTGTRVAALAAVAAFLLTGAEPRGAESRRSAWLDTAMRQARASEPLAVWVYFADKGSASGGAAATMDPSTARARARRARRATPTATTAFEDRALAPHYVAEVGRRVARVRQESRWLNALSVEATPQQIEALSALSFVSRLDVVRRYRRDRGEEIELLPGRQRASAVLREGEAGEPLDYGTGLDQVKQIRVPELHERGLHGEGVVVAMLDSGFPNLGHEAFASMKILATRDFVKGDDSSDGTHSHGTNTLSTIGGFRNGELIGPAFGASFLLAVTEDARSETPVEEDNWVAAAEWAESMGADVISSSLGYVEFDLPFTSYTDRDMDGQTAITTRAAALAAERGVVVVNSAGNEGLDLQHNTLVAPADGVRVVSVAAVDRNGVRASFSSVGPSADGRIKPDVAAMGVRVKVAYQQENFYAISSGTSFSCPLTAGVVALILQAHPTYTVDQVIAALRTTASHAETPDSLLGWGLVDAVRAVDVELPAPDPGPSQTVSRSLLAPVRPR